MVFVVRQRRYIPCSSSAETCAPLGTSVSVTPRGSSTRPSSRRSHADSWPADQEQPAPVPYRPARGPHWPRSSSGHSCRRPGRRTVHRTGADGRTSKSPTVSQRKTTRHSSLKTRPVICTLPRWPSNVSVFHTHRIVCRRQHKHFSSFCRTVAHQHDCFHRCVSCWNDLPTTVTNATSLQVILN